MDWGSTQYSIMRFDSTGCQSPVLESQVNRNMLPYVEYMRTESPNTLLAFTYPSRDINASF